MDFGNIVSMNIYLTKAEDIAAADDVYWKKIGANHPARAVLTVADLPNGDRIEINCIAVANTLPRHAVWPEGGLRGPHRDPPAILAGEMLYLSAQGGHDPVTGRPAPNFTAEVKQALDNVSTIMKAAHMSIKNVVWVNPYMSVSGQYDVMSKIYATYFEFGDTPGRGTIQVMGLPHNDHIVFSCIAGSDLNKRKAVRPRNMPPSPTASPGILYGDTLYLSAKDGFIPDQGLVTPDLVLQARQSMRNLLDGLQEADMDFSSVVSSTIYMREIKDAGKEEEIYGEPMRTINTTYPKLPSTRTMNNPVVLLVLLVAVLFFGSMQSQAQVDTGSISGRLTYPAGATVAGATVEIRNEDTGLQQSYVTKSDGR